MSYRRTQSAIFVFALMFFGLCAHAQTCSVTPASVWNTDYSCGNPKGILHVVYTADMGSITIMESDAAGDWSRFRPFFVFYPDGTAGELTLPPVRWPEGEGGYIRVETERFCETGYASNVQLIKLPLPDCPIPPTVKDRYFLQFEIATDPATPYIVEREVPSSGVVDAQLALGSVFSPRIVKKRSVNGGIASVIPVVSVYSQPVNRIVPLLETQYNLWDQATTISLSGGESAASTLKYAAVHLGQTDFVMLPVSESLPAVTLHLAIVRPPSLGGSHNEWDRALIDAGHERGIPPQILKGQIRQESPDFRDSEFRYEPCSADFAEISRGARLIDTEPYEFYAMDTPAQEDAGFADTVDLRNALYIIDGGTGERRHITHADAGVTARAIWEASDVWPQNNPDGKGQKWSRQDCGALKTFLRKHTLDEFLPALEFVAQTPTASSYGVMQAMYSTALAYDWSVADPERTGSISRSPRYLRDTAEALAIKNGGSIFVGGSEDVQRYWDQNEPNPLTFLSQEDFYDSFKWPLRMYTGGGKSQANYGINIIDTYQFDYLPQQPDVIFK